MTWTRTSSTRRLIIAMSLSNRSVRTLVAVPRAAWVRSMHTPGRQIPNHPTPSTSPHNPHDVHNHHQTLTMPPENSHLLDPEQESTSPDLTTDSGVAPRASKSSPIKRAAQYSLPPVRHSPTPLSTHTPKGKLIPTRPPARTTMPSVNEDKTSQLHPLWKFFRTAEEGKFPLGGMGLTLDELRNLPKTADEAGSGMGSLEPIMENDRNLKSGASCTRAVHPSSYRESLILVFDSVLQVDHGRQRNFGKSHSEIYTSCGTCSFGSATSSPRRGKRGGGWVWHWTESC